MKKQILKILNIIAFVLIPVFALVRYFYAAQIMDYGRRQLTINSLFVLFFGVYCFFICTFNFIRVYKSWKEESLEWEKEMKTSYILTILFALSLFFLMIIPNPMNAIFYGMFVPPAFLFPIGIVLLILGFSALRYNKSKTYLVITFVTGSIFVLVGAIPTLFVFGFWLDGGFSM